MQRRLAAILHADIAGYSRLTGADEEGTFRALKTSLELLARTIVDHGGRVVNTAGDAVLAEFASVTLAVRCAVAAQRGLAAPGANASNDPRLDFRIGVHLGDVIVDGDNILGEGVNVAARLQALADTGGVCISRTVFNQVRNKVEVGFQCLGERTLKNIAEPVVVYRVLLDPKPIGAVIDAGGPAAPLRRRLWQTLAVAIILTGAAGAAALWLRPWSVSVESTVRAKPVLPLIDRRFVAVLPFQNLSGDRGQDYFSDGITEDIIAALGRFSEIAVIARGLSLSIQRKEPELARAQ
jgi:adenylate cyclase